MLVHEPVQLVHVRLGLTSTPPGVTLSNDSLSNVWVLAVFEEVWLLDPVYLSLDQLVLSCLVESLLVP